MFELKDTAKLGFDKDRLAQIHDFLEQSYIKIGKLKSTQIIVARNSSV